MNYLVARPVVRNELEMDCPETTQTMSSIVHLTSLRCTRPMVSRGNHPKNGFISGLVIVIIQIQMIVYKYRPPGKIEYGILVKILTEMRL